jgi:hypothetical protein
MLLAAARCSCEHGAQKKTAARTFRAAAAMVARPPLPGADLASPAHQLGSRRRAERYCRILGTSLKMLSMAFLSNLPAE